MSKVGKKPITVPKTVQIKVDGQVISAKGPKGELKVRCPDVVSVKLEGVELTFAPRGETKQAVSSWGTSRALVSNIITGVTQGFEKRLEIVGVGYKAAVQGKNLSLSLGYSHDVNFAIPAGIAIVTPKPTEIVISGIDCQQVGEVAAVIRSYRPPEPYKGKGVKYANEFIFRKEGKKK